MVVTYLCGHIGAFLHTTMERHVVCAEHGDLIHAEQVKIAPEITRPQVQKAAPLTTGHEHCATAHMLTFGREIIESPSLATSTPFKIEPVLVPRLAATPIRGPTLCVYRIAPKTSPPIA